jgi:hypothetical protein
VEQQQDLSLALGGVAIALVWKATARMAPRQCFPWHQTHVVSQSNGKGSVETTACN